MAIEFTPLEWVNTDDPVSPATLTDPFLNADTLNAREAKLAELVEQINALLADAGQTELDLAAKADLVGGRVPDGQIPVGVTRDSELSAVATSGKFSDATDLDDSAAAPGRVVAVTGTGPLAYGFTEIPAPEVTQAELDSGLSGKADTSALTAHTGSTVNPHSVTKAQVGLGSVDNVAAESLRDRATHTGSQPSTSISDFTEAVQDAVAALLGAGSNVILNYDDAAGTLTVSATGSGGTGLDVEQVRDAIGVAMVGAGNIAVTVNDAADTITISTTATANATDAQLRDRSTHTGAQAISTVTGLQGALDAKTALTVDGTPMSSYDLDTTPVTPGDIGAQPADPDLTAMAGLAPANDDLLQRKAGAWANRTPAQVKTDLALGKGDVGLSAVDNTSDANKPISTATQTALNAKAPTSRAVTAGTGLTGGGDLTADRALAVAYGTAAGSAAQGNDGRFTQVAVNTQTGTGYTLVLADAGRAVEMNNAAANTLTVPPNSSVAFPVGTVIEVCQYGAGQTTVAAGAGVTLRAPDGAKLAKQYASASIRKRATDEWIIAGSVTA